MPTLKTRVIPEPTERTRTVLKSKVTPVIRGEGGDVTYLCGACNAVLVESITPGQVTNIVFQCPICNAFSEI